METSPETLPKRGRELIHTDEEGHAHIVVKLAGYPEWDVPLALPKGVFSEEEEAIGEEERQAGFEARRATLDQMAPPVEALIATLGGERTDSSWRSGWISARMDFARIDELMASPLVAGVSPYDGDIELLSWNLGEAGTPERYNSDALVSAGYSGSDTTIGIVEPGMLNDEACFLFNGASCISDSRLLSIYQCDNPDSGQAGNCDLVTNMNDNPTWNSETNSHATLVASAAMADYTDNQAMNYRVGDPAWTPGGFHTSTWKSRASSAAKEVSLRFAGGFPKTSISKAKEALGKLADTDVVAINMSFWSTSVLCDPTADSGGLDEDVENAFDDGKLMVHASGNNPTTDNDNDPFGPCDVTKQASLPKAFAVNGLANNPGFGGVKCYNDYLSTCVVETGASSHGGAGIRTPDNAFHSGALSLISMAAAQANLYLTGHNCDESDSLRGFVWNDYPNPLAFCQGGTNAGASLAAPVVTGVAALVHEWGTAFFGAGSMNGVGKLHAVMLGMGDSHSQAPNDSTTQQIDTRADPLLGMGRLKVHKPPIAALKTVLVTAVTPAIATAIPGPLPTGYDMVKCVALQHEDMSEKSRVSHVELQLRMKLPSMGTCSINGTNVATVIDDSYDIKKMTAFRSSSAVGKCAYATVKQNQVFSPGVAVTVYCYASTENDDAPN